MGACLGTNLLGDAALENGPSIRAAIGLVPSVPIGFDADQLHIRRNLPIEPALMVRHPHGILPRSVLRGGASNDDETKAQTGKAGWSSFYRLKKGVGSGSTQN